MKQNRNSTNLLNRSRGKEARSRGKKSKILRKDLGSRYQEFGRNNLAILTMGMFLAKIVPRIFSLGVGGCCCLLARFGGGVLFVYN